MLARKIVDPAVLRMLNPGADDALDLARRLADEAPVGNKRAGKGGDHVVARFNRLLGVFKRSEIGVEDHGKRRVFCEKPALGQPHVFRNRVLVRRNPVFRAVEFGAQVVGPGNAKHLCQAQHFAPVGAARRELHQVEMHADDEVFAHGLADAAHDVEHELKARQLRRAPDVASMVGGGA